VDIYEKIRPGASQAQLVRVGRIATAGVVGLGILWIPVMPLISKGGLYAYLQSVQSYLAPPITAVFLLGLFSKRVNARGAVLGLSIGFVLGMVKLTIQAFFGTGKREAPAVLAAIGDFNFLYYSGLLFLVSVGIIILGSLSAPAPDAEKIARLTYQTETEADRRERRASFSAWDVVTSAVVVGGTLTMYVYFSVWLRP
jgi:SSS family solute:Na+ symporter